MSAAAASTLASRAAASPWVARGEGLAEAVAAWAHATDAIAAKADRATALGPVSPLRALRYAGALEVSRLRWATGQLLTPGLRPLREPGDWAKEGVAQVLHHQLELLGPAGAEIARIIAGSEGLLPGTVVSEFRRRPVTIPAFPTARAESIVQRCFDGRVDRLSEAPLAATPLTQLHAAILDGERRVLVRVRRPGARRDTLADARMTAAIARALEAVVPALRDVHPLGFVELATRQTVEALDLRHEAINAVELAMALEDLGDGADGITVLRPVAGLATARAVVLEDLPGARSFAAASSRLDPEPTIAAYVRATLEVGLASGVFHADLRPEHLVVLPDGTLGVVGCGTLGRFDLVTRRAAFGFLTALFAGDHRGQVDAMRLAGAVPDDVDADALVADLAGTPSLSPMAILSGGGDAIATALGDSVRILLRHRLRPPIDVVLFVRNVFAVREILATIAPETSLVAALIPLVQRLPDLAARLEPTPV